MTNRRPWLQHLLAIVVLWLCFAAVFPEITVEGKIFATPDYDSPSYFGAAGQAALASGEYPLWNPYLFLGLPSFSSLVFTPYVYPPSEILAALGKLPLTPPLGWLIFYYLAAGYGVFLLLRYLRAAYWAAIASGVAFMLLPHLVSMGVFGHGSKLASVAYLPYLTLLAMRLREPGRRLLWTALLGIAVGLLLLRGHPQIAFYGLFLLGLVGLFEIIAQLRARAPRGEILRFAAGLAAGVVLGFGLAAVVLLPVRAYARVSIRGATDAGGTAYQYATNWSFSPDEIATFFLPAAAGFGEGTYVGTMPFTNFPNYLGTACLLFGVAALLLLRGRVVVWLLLVGLVALLVSFGRNFPFVYDLFYRHMPYFNKFRVPVMILVLQQLCACLLLGLGLSALWGRLPRDVAWRHAPQSRDALRLVVAAVATAVFLALIVQPWSGALAVRIQQNPRLPEEAKSVYASIGRHLLQADGLRVAALLVLQALGVWALWRRRLPADVVGIALVALVVFDVGNVDRKMVSPQKTWPGVQSRIGLPHRENTQPPPIARFLQSQQDGAAPVRILPAGSGFMNNEWMQWGIASAGGYHPAKLARFEELVDTRRQTLERPLLDLFAVRFVVLQQPMSRSSLQPVYEGSDGVVYENPDAYPRAWVTGRWRLLQPGTDCRTQLLAPELDRRHVALLESPPEPAPDSSATGSAQIVEFSANRLALEVESSAPGLVVIAESYHPDWRARVNGTERPVMPCDCTLRAVTVPAGHSRVELVFRDPALQRGLAVTLAALGLITALIVLSVLRRTGWRAGAMPDATANAGSGS